MVSETVTFPKHFVFFVILPFGECKMFTYDV